MQFKLFLAATNVAFVAAISTLLVGCSKSDADVISYNRDIVYDISAELVPFDIDTVLISSNAYLAIADSILFIEDAQGSDKLIHAYNIESQVYLGSFVDFGPGPYEIGVPDLPILFKGFKDGRLKFGLLDHSQHKLMSFDVDSALNDNDYRPMTLRRFDNLLFPSRYKSLNDTSGICNRIRLKEDSYEINQTLARYNLATGEMTDFINDEIHPEGIFTSAVSSDGKILAAEPSRDQLMLYDNDGKLLSLIRGPEYQSELNRKKSFVTRTVSAGDKFVTAYSGGSYTSDYLGKILNVYQSDGTYLVSLPLGVGVIDMVYNPATGRLYFSLDSDEQFAFIEFDDILGRVI